MQYNISEQDLFLFHQGTNYHTYQMLGCHQIKWKDKVGFRFGVWAPHAKQIQVVGDFNHWGGHKHHLRKINDEGVWLGFFPDIAPKSRYKYSIVNQNGEINLKADPFAFYSELRPATASLTPYEDAYTWKDSIWQKKQQMKNSLTSPINIYEIHIGSWRVKDNGEFYSYRELVKELIPYIKDLGYTHLELLPLGEHPFDLSWGYQMTGYYSVTSRYGTLNDFKYFVDQCHQHNVGIIMDWVPGHFCKDSHGLRLFDGTPVYEYADPNKSEKKSWGTLTFDFGKPEVQSFLISNAIYWLQELHIDGIRVDAVASMLYLNFDKGGEEEKVFNSYGTEENLEATAFIKKLNEIVFKYKPETLMMAEDSSDLPLITAPTYLGGLGFNYKWNMGWMNDTLRYMKDDPVHRKWHHNLLTFSFMYTFSENFVLPLSHDEVVHGKKSLLDKMPGDQWQQFANLRLLLGYKITHPGKKLLFMGGEFGQYAEWKDKEQLDWHLLDYPLHRAMHKYIKALNRFYVSNTSLFELDHKPEGFQWIDPHNIDQSIISFLRRGNRPSNDLIIICNFTPNVYYNYKIGVPSPGIYRELFNSDSIEYGGSNQMNEGQHFSFYEKWHGHPQHIKVKIPPLGITIFQRINENTEGESE